jgi:sugar lactone lactonase YvrE
MARNAQLNLRVASAVDGRPGLLYPLPDASNLCVFDLDRPQVHVLGTTNLEKIRTFELPSPSNSSRSFLGASNGIVFWGSPHGVGLLDPVRGKLRGPLALEGRPCDVAALPGGRQLVVTVAGEKYGRVELWDLERGRCEARLALPMPPVAETLTLFPERDLGAVALHAADRDEDVVVCWRLSTLMPHCRTTVGAGARSLAFDPDGQSLFVACHGDSEVLVVDVWQGKITQCLRMAGRPFQVHSDRMGRTVWALCESLGNVAILDAGRGSLTARVPLRGVKASSNRAVFTPEGKLAAIPEGEGGSVALVNHDARGRRYGELEDRLEVGRSVASACWSPLGDELYVTDDALGAVLALSLDRGDINLNDTSELIHEQLREPAPWGPRAPDS